jgi:uncharacterized membrane protein YjjP (DUF1212 family)
MAHPTALSGAPDDPVGFVLRLGRAFHAAGYPAHRLEQLLKSASGRLGLEGQFFSTPTSLLAAFGPVEQQRAHIIRVDVGNVHLARLAALDVVARDVESGRATPAQGSARIDAIEAAPAPWGTTMTVIAFALASAAGSRLLGGGLHEVGAALAAGLVLGVFVTVIAPRLPTLDLLEFVGGLMCAAIVAMMVAAGYRCSIPLTILGGVVTLLPGLALTTAMMELGSRHLASGTARLGGAVVSLFALAAGSAIGPAVVEIFAGSLPSARAVPLEEWTRTVALGVAPLAFGVLLAARPRDLPWILVVALLGFGGMKAGQRWLGPELGASVGALAVGIAANAAERARAALALVLIVPGILLLVPGSLGFNSVTALLDQNVVRGVAAWSAMVTTAVALAAGLLLSNVLLPPQRVVQPRG